MRVIISFDGGLTINFENVDRIYDAADHIILEGGAMRMVVNAFDICAISSVIIRKAWLLAANEVYLDTRIEEVNES